MAVKRTATKKNTSNDEKLFVKEVIEVMFFDKITVRTNSNKKEYIATPHGAVYSRVKETKPGLYTVCKLSNDMIVLNRPTMQETLAFIQEQKKLYPDFTVGEIKELYNL